MIVLTAEEADKIKGRSPKDRGHALLPTPLKDGRFFLGPEVLDDPAHDDVRDFLAALPREPLETLPLYTESDEAPASVETATLTVRTAIAAGDTIKRR